jgi:membrane associated rhomboid family serine protease
VFNAPGVVMAALGLVGAVHAVRSYLLTEAQDQWVVLTLAFIPARYAGEVLPGGAVADVTSFLTHAFLHGDLTHLLVNGGWMLAFGSIVARRISAGRFVLLSAVSAVAGAALFLLTNWGLLQPMVGASGAISGLMGAAVRFMFQPGARSAASADDGGWRPPAMTLAEVARDPRARMMIGSWLALNLVFGLFLGSLFSTGGIAWEAHVGGFAAGLLLFGFFERSGPRSAGRSNDGDRGIH